MGRRENAVVVVTEESAKLAHWLREQRQLRGLTYPAMAHNTTYTATMLSRAASGRTVPSLKIVLEYTRLCDADPRKAERLWKDARRADQHLRRQENANHLGSEIAAKVYDGLAARPELIADFVQLRCAMVGRRAKGGQPSLRALQERAGCTAQGAHRLPASSLGAVLRGEAVPGRHHVTAFFRAMGEPPHTVAKWAAAWDRAAAGPHGTYPSGILHSAADQVPNWAPERSAAPTVRKPKIAFEIKVSRAADAAPPTTPRGPEPGRQAPLDGLRPEDITYLRTHGLPACPPAGPSGQPDPPRGPRPPLPPAGYTGSGLPIRVPRRHRAQRRLARPQTWAFRQPFVPTWATV